MNATVKTDLKRAALVWFFAVVFIFLLVWDGPKVAVAYALGGLTMMMWALACEMKISNATNTARAAERKRIRAEREEAVNERRRQRHART